MHDASAAAFPWKWMAVTAVLWGSAFPAIRIALSDYSATAVPSLRIAIASLLMSWNLRGGPAPDRRALARMAAFGLTGLAGYQFLLCAGQESVTASNAAMLVAASPLIVALLGIPMLRELPSRTGAVGLVVALAGALLIALEERGGGGKGLAGVGLVVGAALAQAMSFVVQKPLLNRYSGNQCVFYGGLFALLPLAPFAASTVGDVSRAGWQATAAVVWLGVVCTALAFWTWGQTLARTSAATASTVIYGVPVSALVIDSVLTRSVPAPLTLVGGALVLTGVVLVGRNPGGRR